MTTSAEEEAAIEELLAGIRPAAVEQEPEQVAGGVASVPQSKSDVRALVDEIRDRKVFDAAIGGPGTWTIVEGHQVEEFCQQRHDGTWEACVSVILSLHQSADGEHMHDETGTGHTTGADRSMALQQAVAKANASARKRLAKLYAVALAPELLGAIEKAAWKEATGGEAPPRQPWRRQPQQQRRCPAGGAGPSGSAGPPLPPPLPQDAKRWYPR